MRLITRFTLIAVASSFFLASPLAATTPEIVESDLVKLFGGASSKCTSGR